MSRVSGTGIYGNSIVPRENPDDVQELTAEQVKQAYEDAVRADATAQAEAISIENGKAFLAGHPEFINTSGNIALMNHELRNRFGAGRAYTISEYEQAFASLRESNFLNLNKNVLAAQAKQAHRERYEADRARTAARAFNPNADYDNMSLEEIRQRADEDLRERGGNGF